MTHFIGVCVHLLDIYRERGNSVDFWAEPRNALSNACFLFAAIFALDLARRRQVQTSLTNILLLLAGSIAFGSFAFHTIPNCLTLWLDVIPIALFQTLFLWLVAHRMLGWNAWASATVVLGVVGSSFCLFPLHEPFNGSLFYLPSLLAMLIIGVVWSLRSSTEPYLIVGAACCFAFAIGARSADWAVPWHFGTHFLWHTLNGVVVYLLLRAWIVHLSHHESQDSDDGRFNLRSV